MFSQTEDIVSDATVRIQPRSSILTPVPDNTLNLSDDPNYGGKKRKRDGNTMDDLLKDTFIVRVSLLADVDGKFWPG
jgi:DNA replication regulator SLD3